MLCRDRAAESKHMMQGFFYGPLHSLELIGVSSNEVLMRVAIARVAVHDGSRGLMPGDGFARLAERDIESVVGHRPIG